MGFATRTYGTGPGTTVQITVSSDHRIYLDADFDASVLLSVEDARRMAFGLFAAARAVEVANRLTCDHCGKTVRLPRGVVEKLGGIITRVWCNTDCSDESADQWSVRTGECAP